MVNLLVIHLEVDKDLDSTWTIYSHNLRYFGGGQQFGGQQRRQQKGGDLNIRLSLNIEEIITGCAKKSKV
jgi:DnaJ-class molecular chaperone